MGPRHPASETAGQRAEAHDIDDSPLDSTQATAEKPNDSSKSKGVPTNKENVIR